MRGGERAALPWFVNSPSAVRRAWGWPHPFSSSLVPCCGMTERLAELAQDARLSAMPADQKGVSICDHDNLTKHRMDQ